MSELREILLCEDCLGQHDEDCRVLGCECWCRDPETSFWGVAAMVTTGLVLTEIVKHPEIVKQLETP